MLVCSKRSFKCSPLCYSGTILTIETDTIKAFDRFKENLDPEGCCWFENKDKFKRVTQVIRIVYVKGPPAGEQIGTYNLKLKSNKTYLY